MPWLSPVIATAATVVGIIVSYWLDTSSGGMIVLTLGLGFTLVYLFGRNGLLRKALPRSGNVTEDALATNEAA